MSARDEERGYDLNSEADPYKHLVRFVDDGELHLRLVGHEPFILRNILNEAAEKHGWFFARILSEHISAAAASLPSDQKGASR